MDNHKRSCSAWYQTKKQTKKSTYHELKDQEIVVVLAVAVAVAAVVAAAVAADGVVVVAAAEFVDVLVVDGFENADAEDVEVIFVSAFVEDWTIAQWFVFVVVIAIAVVAVLGEIVDSKTCGKFVRRCC